MLRLLKISLATLVTLAALDGGVNGQIIFWGLDA